MLSRILEDFPSTETILEMVHKSLNYLILINNMNR